MADVQHTPDPLNDEQQEDLSPPPSPMTAAMRAIETNLYRQSPSRGFEDDGLFGGNEPDRTNPRHSATPEPERRKRPLPQSPEMRNLVGQAQEISKTKKLRPESQAELRGFTQMSGPQRELFAAALMLQVRDRLVDIAESADWCPPAQLKTNCTRYAVACIMSPVIPSYYLTFSAIVMKLLHALDVEVPGSSQLPSELNASQTKIVCDEINEVAIKKRSELKSKIEKSLASKECIELLCEKIATPLKITPTTLLYARIAFLRQQCVKYPDMRSGKKFWAFIDKQLKALRDKFRTKETMAVAMEYFLKEDRAMFTVGKDDKQYQFSDPFEVPKWQQATDRELETIVPVELSPDSSAGADVQAGGSSNSRQPRTATPRAPQFPAGPTGTVNSTT